MPPQRSTTAASSNKPAAAAAAAAAQSIDPAAILLQERLHELLSRLSATVDWVRHWPDDGQDDASIHVQSTSKLISLIRSVLTAIQAVEKTVVDDPKLKERLDQTLIPMDLIELLDHTGTTTSGSRGSGGGGAMSSSATDTSGGGLNPDAFSRGLLKEALGQLAGLKRRKLALEMLSMEIQHSGAKRRYERELEAAAAAAAAAATGDGDAKPAAVETTKKRARSDEETGAVVEPPPAKKQHVS